MTNLLVFTTAPVSLSDWVSAITFCHHHHCTGGSLTCPSWFLSLSTLTWMSLSSSLCWHYSYHVFNYLLLPSFVLLSSLFCCRYCCHVYHYLLLWSPFVLLSSPFVLLSSPFVLLSSLFVLLSSPCVIVITTTPTLVSTLLFYFI